MLHRPTCKSHWMVLLYHENKVYWEDPLGIPTQNYQLLYCRLEKFYKEVTQILKPKPIQNQNLKLCGLFYLYCSCNVWLRISFDVEYERY